MKIIVAGSINMDLVVRSEEIPKPGETVPGKDFTTIPGGKGANQAAAIAKLGGSCVFLGKVGNDDFGTSVLESMKASGINVDLVEKEKTSTGVSIINVDARGNNNIVFVAGANALVDEAYINRHIDAFKDASMVVMQNEIPKETIRHILKVTRDMNIIRLLNPAPAMDIEDDMLKEIDILIPNEHELARLSKVTIDSKESVRAAAGLLLDRGLGRIIVTLGEHGAFYKDKEKEKFYTAYKANIVDTTAAGDSFIGGFCNSFVESGDIDKSIDFGQRTAAIAIGRFGAQTSIPSREEVLNFKPEG